MQGLGPRFSLSAIICYSFHGPSLVRFSRIGSCHWLSMAIELAVLLTERKKLNGGGFSAHFLSPCSNPSASSVYIAPAECCHTSVIQVAVPKPPLFLHLVCFCTVLGLS